MSYVETYVSRKRRLAAQKAAETAGVLWVLDVRRATVEVEIARLRDALAGLEKERPGLDEAVRVLGGAAEISEAARAFARGEARAAVSRGKPSASGTIKAHLLAEIANHPAGIRAAVLFERVNALLDVPRPRTTLMPQLSRLGQEGRVRHDGELWLPFSVSS